MASKMVSAGTFQGVVISPIGFEGGWNLFGYTEQNPINFVDPNGLDAYLSHVVVRGGTYNALGHSWLEVTPIPGTGSNWGQRTSYASYPKGVLENADLKSGYGPGTERVRVKIRLNAEQERKFLKWYKKNKAKEWTPQSNCANFSIEGWNAVAPDSMDINYGDTMETITPDLVNDSRAQKAIRLHKKITGSYPLNVTPRQLGRHINTMPGHVND
jgi:uncharacterized protein RhaS with RHS repeats